MEANSDYGAFMDKFIIQPTSSSSSSSSSSQELPLNALTFAVKDIFDMDGYVTGFGNPDWARTHPAATSTAPAVIALLRGGATCVGRTIMDEMAYSSLPGWFARDPAILNRVGRVLLQLLHADPVEPSHIIIAEDCFNLLSIPSDRITTVLVNSVNKIFGDIIISYTNLGDYVDNKVQSLKHFMRKDTGNQEYNIEPLMALSNAMRSLQRHEFKNNHGEWVRTVKPDLTPGISERVWEAVNSTDDNIDDCRSVKTELHAALTALLGDSDILAIPTVPGPPPKLQTEATSVEAILVRAFSCLSLAGLSGFCQVSIPLGMYDNLPVAVSLLARHGSDGFLLNVVETLYGTLQEQVEIAEKLSY